MEQYLRETQMLDYFCNIVPDCCIWILVNRLTDKPFPVILKPRSGN